MTGTNQRQLEIDAISKRYGDTVAVEELSFDVRAGELFGFVGRNGAGKTTTMRIVLGVLARGRGRGPLVRRARSTSRPGAGSATCPRSGASTRRCASRSSSRTSASSTAWPARTRGRRPSDWLERFGLADRRNAELQALSLGNQQRIQLAAALVFAPEVLVLDEPFAGLDPVAVDVMSGGAPRTGRRGRPGHLLQPRARAGRAASATGSGSSTTAAWSPAARWTDLRPGGPDRLLGRRALGAGGLGRRAAGRDRGAHRRLQRAARAGARGRRPGDPARRADSLDLSASSERQRRASSRSSVTSSGRRSHDLAVAGRPRVALAPGTSSSSPAGRSSCACARGSSGFSRS